MWKIYRLLLEGQVVYVGRTKTTLKERKKGSYGKNTQFFKKCTIELIEETDDVSRERYWIKYYKDEGCNLMNGNAGDGLNRVEYRKKYREENEEYFKQKGIEYYQKNSDKVKERNKKFYNENKDNINLKEYRKKYYLNNREELIEYMEQYNEANKERLKEYRKQYYKEYYRKKREQTEKDKMSGNDIQK
jgi:hypothetical protein